MNVATAFAPASVSNVACGFDIMGFALEGPGDRVTVRRSDTPGIHITDVRGCKEALPREPRLNTAGAPVLAIAGRCQYGGGISIEIEKGFPMGSGLGSSAASAVAAAVATNALLDAGLSKKDLLEFALAGEMVASGSCHADNVAPSLFGGFILVRGYDPIDVISIATPDTLWCAIVHQHFTIATKESRKLLPEAVPLKDVVVQTGNAAGLVAGLLTSDLSLVGRSLHDVIAEPARAHTIPRFQELRNAALEAGALGCSISGSGPAVFALASGPDAARKCAKAMVRSLGITPGPHDVYVSPINNVGATLLD